jgi:hypothetical protein
MTFCSNTFKFRPRTKKSYLCLFPKCLDNAAPTYRNGLCAKHNKLNLSDEALFNLRIARDREQRPIHR